MTREEELDWLCRLRSEIYVYMPKEWLIPMNNALDMAISALSENNVLDKIRAEIEEQREEVSNKHSEDEGLTNYYFGLNDGLKDARDIIDKYKAESEE